MFIQNSEDLLKLTRNDTEKEVMNVLLSSINDLLAFAQPSIIMSNAILFDNNTLKINGNSVDLSSYENFYLVAFGKASQTMSSWMMDNFPLSFSRIIIVSPEEIQSRFTSMPSCQCFRGGHPIPNEQSVLAAEEVLKLLQTLTERDLCFFLISGGGSALLESPDFNISLQEYQLLQKGLLSCGAPIHEINVIRKHFSKVKGGKLAAVSNTSIMSFIISDVIGSDPSSIASGPTVPDETTWKDCEAIFQKYTLFQSLPEVFGHLISQGVNGIINETPSDPALFSNTYNYVIGNNIKLLDFIKEKLSLNYPVEILDYKISGEAKVLGDNLAKKAIQHYSKAQTNYRGLSLSFLLFGGETTVTLSPSTGVGGRNQELALSFVLSSNAHESLFLACFGTDGIDGNSKAAGAIVGPFTLKNEQIKNDASKSLSSNDTNSFLKKYGGELLTGYTGTNMMDIGIICIVIEEQF
ncbi:MAG: DUF4147 domain-containing protein [Candidatus Heimdallarchaeota archaeon]|nr:DUF4147 domain-containing protein [Candidatus Heimdallarchaeota archaeon]